MMTNDQARECFESGDLIELGMEADALRGKLHPHGIASYIIDRNINHTNECTEYCSFCAFYRPMGHAEGYVLPFETIAEKIQETVDCGGTGVLMQGGVNPHLDIGYFESLFSRLKQRFPEVQLHCLSAPEVQCIAEVSNLTPPGHAGPPPGRRHGLHAWRGSRDPRRRGAFSDRPPEMHSGRVGPRSTAPRTRSACRRPPR